MKLFGYKKCSTVAKARNFLNEKNIKYTYIDLVEDGIDAKTIEKWLIEGLDLENLINKRSITYRNIKAKDIWPNLTDKEKIAFLVENPKLIKRPILEFNNKCYLGFSEEAYNDIKF